MLTLIHDEVKQEFFYFCYFFRIYSSLVEILEVDIGLLLHPGKSPL